MADFNLFSEGRSPQVPLRPESGGAKLPLCPDLTIGEGNEAGVRATRRSRRTFWWKLGRRGSDRSTWGEVLRGCAQPSKLIWKIEFDGMFFELNSLCQ